MEPLVIVLVSYCFTYTDTVVVGLGLVGCMAALSSKFFG
jgi:succinate dehydrogenase/fumarate reductase flavoprotein subunit